MLYPVWEIRLERADNLTSFKDFVFKTCLKEIFCLCITTCQAGTLFISCFYSWEAGCGPAGIQKISCICLFPPCLLSFRCLQQPPVDLLSWPQDAHGDVHPKRNKNGRGSGGSLWQSKLCLSMLLSSPFPECPLTGAVQCFSWHTAPWETPIRIREVINSRDSTKASLSSTAQKLRHDAWAISEATSWEQPLTYHSWHSHDTQSIPTQFQKASTHNNDTIPHQKTSGVCPHKATSGHFKRL